MKMPNAQLNKTDQGKILTLEILGNLWAFQQPHPDVSTTTLGCGRLKFREGGSLPNGKV